VARALGDAVSDSQVRKVLLRLQGLTIGELRNNVGHKDANRPPMGGGRTMPPRRDQIIVRRETPSRCPHLRSAASGLRLLLSHVVLIVATVSPCSCRWVSN
jgi:hypothetical protein